MSVPAVFKPRTWTTDVLIREPADVYHAQREKYLTSHQLADFRRNPPLYKKKLDGVIRDEDRPAYLVGRAAHTLILEGRQAYDREYAFGGPVNPRTGEPFGSRSKAYAEWAAAQGKPVLDDDQALLVENLCAAVRAHTEASALLAEGVPEGVVRTEYCGVLCQARLDWLNPEKGLIDVKSCDSIDFFEADARSFGYAFQLAFYRSLLANVIGEKVSCFLIGAEKAQPYRVGAWRVSEGVLGLAEVENTKAIERLKGCQDSDNWPSGYETLRVLDWL